MKGLLENTALWKDEKGKSNGTSFGGSRPSFGGGSRGPARPSRFGSRPTRS